MSVNWYIIFKASFPPIVVAENLVRNKFLQILFNITVQQKELRSYNECRGINCHKKSYQKQLTQLKISVI